MLKVLYLYSELSPYLEPMFEALVNEYNVELHVVFWDKNRLTAYDHAANKNVRYYQRSDYNSQQIDLLIKTIKPDLIFAVGWMDWGYMQPLFNARKSGIDVACGFDEIWNGTIRQKFGSLAFKILGGRFFNYAFVSFTRQFEFARNLGFDTDNIIMNALSANTELFDLTGEEFSKKIDNYPKSFIFAGRFSPEKGIQDLLEAFSIYKNKLGGDWGLTLIGDGPLEVDPDIESINVLGFQDPTKLRESFRQAGAFVLPSRSDKSPLVVHEACCSGLPVILSSNIGNKTTFLIEGLNGFSFKSGDVQDLALALKKFDDIKLSKLADFSRMSYNLSKRVSPTISAGSLLSIIFKKQCKGVSNHDVRL